MKNINDIHVTGKIVQDPVIKAFDNGSLKRLRIAFPNPSRKIVNGYIDVTLWDNLGEIEVSKGDRVDILGELEYREWVKDEKKHSDIEIRANSITRI